MSPIRPANLLLTFDAFGTLFTPRLPIAAQYTLVARNYGLADVKDADIQVTFKNAFKEESKRNPNYGKDNGIQPDEWWANIIKNTFTAITSSPPPASLTSALLHRFASNIGYKLYPDVISLLRAVRSPPSAWPYRSVTIGVITNSDYRVTSVLNSLGVGVRSYRQIAPGQPDGRDEGVGDQALLDFVTLSYDIGYEKPDVRIFDAAKRIGSQNPSMNANGLLRCVHVGDDAVKDYQGAEMAGWNGILVDRMSESKVNPQQRVVKGLDEILKILIDLEISNDPYII